jgi:hypothetical protein
MRLVHRATSTKDQGRGQGPSRQRRQFERIRRRAIAIATAAMGASSRTFQAPSRRLHSLRRLENQSLRCLPRRPRQRQLALEKHPRNDQDCSRAAAAQRSSKVRTRECPGDPRGSPTYLASSLPPQSHQRCPLHPHRLRMERLLLDQASLQMAERTLKPTPQRLHLRKGLVSSPTLLESYLPDRVVLHHE